MMSVHVFHIKPKSARAYSRLFKLKLCILIDNISCRFKKVLEAYSGFNDIHVNFYETEAWYAFCSNSCILIQITSDSQTAQSNFQHFSGRVNILLFLCNKYFDKKLSDALAKTAFSMLGQILYQSRH